MLGVQRVQLHRSRCGVELQPLRRRHQPAHCLHCELVQCVAVLQHQHIRLCCLLAIHQQQFVRHRAVHLLHRHRLFCSHHRLRCWPVSEHRTRDWQLDAAWRQRRVLAMHKRRCGILLFEQWHQRNHVLRGCMHQRSGWIYVLHWRVERKRDVPCCELHCGEQ